MAEKEMGVKPPRKSKMVPAKALRLKKYYKIKGEGAVRLNLDTATKSCSFKKSVRSVFDANLAPAKAK